jgi:fucose permease
MNNSKSMQKLDIVTWASFIMLATSAIIVAVCLPEISKTFSTNLAEGGGIETARSTVMLTMLLVAGALAQRWGKKRFLTLGQYLVATGLILASFAPNYVLLVLALMITGAGGGFTEALLNPLIVAMHPRQSGKYLNIGHAFYPVGIVGAALLFGELLTMSVSWRVLFQIAGAGSLVVAILFTVLPFPPDQFEKSSYVKQFGGILARKSFWIFAAAIALGAAIESAFTFWSRSYVGAYLSDVPRAGAFAVVIFAGAMAIGRFGAGFLANRTSLNNIMVGSAVLGIVVSALIPFTTSLAGFYSFLALAGLATACFWPTIMAEAEDYLNATSLRVNSTILFIMLACAGIIGFGLTPWILGMIGDSSELRSGFIVIPLLFTLLVVVLLVERRYSRRQTVLRETERAAA